MSAAYYNEIDPYAARWLRNLMSVGAILSGEVDERSIADVQVADLRSFRQCHFFAGVAGWAYALDLAGWGDREVWTGSCPCPYSPRPTSARSAHAVRARVLSGALEELAMQYAQTANTLGLPTPATFGRSCGDSSPSFDLQQSLANKSRRRMALSGSPEYESLEILGYSVGAEDIPACSVGAPHIRQRLFWVADAEHSLGRSRGRPEQDVVNGHDTRRPQAHSQLGACSEVRGVGDADDTRPQGRREHVGEHADQRSPWEASYWLNCLDGKARRVPIEPAFQPLADGFPGRRVGTLRGAGNAIVPQVAAKFITAFLEAAR